MSTNRSNTADRIVRLVEVYASGKVRHRAADNASSLGWGKPGAHAEPVPTPAPAPAPAVKSKDPKKVAAGKARAAQAKAARDAAEAAKTATKAKAPAKATRGGKRPGAGAKPKAANGTAMVVVACRVTPEQKKKLAKLGADWMRARIDAATVPAKTR